MIEINIIKLITKYALYQVSCGNDVNASSCPKGITFETEKDMIITMNMDNQKSVIGIVLCWDCGNDKIHQDLNDFCRALHDTMYEGNISRQCHQCDKKLCNRCKYLDAYVKCMKCENFVCRECQKDLYQCIMCDNLVCNTCNDGKNNIVELIGECVKCGDILCKDCLPCCNQLEKTDNQFFYEIE